jgi:putative membrane protein
MGEMMPELGTRKALLLALVFAGVVVVVSSVGPGLGPVLLYLAPLAVTSVVLYFIVRWAVAAGNAGWSGRVRTAREVLDERYARGEIGAEEHGRMRGRLETP